MRQDRCWCDVYLSPVFQVDWRIRLQADLQTLCHALLCVLRGLLREWTRDFRLNPGKCSGSHSASITMFGLCYQCPCWFCSFHPKFFLCFKVFVETLDKCFENVCELDLIFHVDKVGNTSESVLFLFFLNSTLRVSNTFVMFQSVLFSSSSKLLIIIILFFSGPQHPGRDGDGRDGPGDQHEWNHHTGGCPEQDGEVWGKSDLPVHCMYDLILPPHILRYQAQYAGMCVCCTLHATLRWPCGCSWPTLWVFVLFFSASSLCRCTAPNAGPQYISSFTPHYNMLYCRHHFCHIMEI